MTAAAILLAVVGVALVRLGWGGRRGVAILGWIVVAAALPLAARAAGAWGLAAAAAAGMTAALAALLWSGWTTPGRAPRAARERVAAAPARVPARVMRRSAVFLLVVPVAGVAALVLAFGIQAAARRGGLGAADASACLLLLLPFLWCGLMAWQMTREGPRAMAAPPLLAAGIGALIWAMR